MGYWCFLSPPNQSWICVSGKTETNNTRWQSLWSGCLTWCSLQALNIWVFLLSSSHFPLLRLWSSCVVSDACAQLIVPLSLSHFSGAGCQRGSVLQWLLHESGSCWGSIVSKYSAYPSLLRTFTPLNDSPPLLREVFLAAAWQLLAVTALLALMPAMLWVQLGLPFLYQWVPCSFFQRTGEATEKLLCLKCNYLQETLNKGALLLTAWNLWKDLHCFSKSCSCVPGSAGCSSLGSVFSITLSLMRSEEPSPNPWLHSVVVWRTSCSYAMQCICHWALLCEEDWIHPDTRYFSGFCSAV